MYKKVIKRIIDIFLSLVGLVFFIPVFIIVAPIIYLSDKGPVFYNAKRLGKSGKIFKMYKFRSMKVNAPDIRNSDGSTYNGDEDPRLTKIGKIIRKTSIDELPQLLNVLKGDMSFIGPRPDLPEHIKEYNSTEKRKLDVLPGITGYNQAYFRNSIEWHERLKNDVYYVENISFWLDVKIVFKTIMTVLKKEGIFVNKNYELKNLDWDTEYFGVKSGKIVLNNEIDKNDFKNIKKWLKKYQFVTIQNNDNNSINNEIISQIKPFLADVNMQFIKNIDENLQIDKYVSINNNCKQIKELLDIALVSYKHSRFINDRKLDVKKSNALYYNWLKNSFNKKNKYIAYYKKENEYLGYCLFHLENDTCVIELIATDSRSRGKGIGRKVIESVESYCASNRIKTIKVGTQIDNITAQNFYIKCGFKINTYNTIYHVWR